MPCTCWYEPSEESKKLIKYHCTQLILELNRLESGGDPIGISLDSIKELLDHLYRPEICKENPKNE
jgi:hypothetical protein